MRLYLAAPLFTLFQRAWNRDFIKRICQTFTYTTCVLPQDFRHDGCFNDPKHYNAIFKQCMDAVKNSDVVIAVLEGSDVDSGTAVEIGAAYAWGIPIIGVRTDFRPGADKGVNIMCARACKYMVREFSFQEDIQLIVNAVVRRLKQLSKTILQRKS